MRKFALVSLALSIAVLAAMVTTTSSVSATTTTKAAKYVVVYDLGAAGAARAAMKKAGGTIERDNTDVGVATVSTTNSAFAAQAQKSSAVQGVAHERSIGEAPNDAAAVTKRDVEKETLAGAKTPTIKPATAVTADPLASAQWDMQAIGATATGSYATQPGRPDVLVGIMDTGVDGTHPDIAPNLSVPLSRNFTTDIPVDVNGNPFDGPCEHPSCVDPVDEDDDGHGTHVASTIGSPLNGLGIAGVAPNVTLVNVRAGQDSGFFLTQPTVDALTYSGDAGIDVVNMSFYIDPWLFNCTNNPADSTTQQAEQQTIITAVQRALTYAHKKNVTLIAAAGNEAIDYTKPQDDFTSPDFPSVPGEAPHGRTTDPKHCLSLPAEGKNVIPVSATGPSGRKSYFSSFGRNYIDISAPGGDAYDTADQKVSLAGEILAAYPQSIVEANGELNPDGTPNVPNVIRSCNGPVCGYYRYLQGTSMASPHAVGVAALIISRFGKDTGKGGFHMAPNSVAARLKKYATKQACPTPKNFTYTRLINIGGGNFQTVQSTQLCVGSKSNNGFFGAGGVNALNAVTK